MLLPKREMQLLCRVNEVKGYATIAKVQLLLSGKEWNGLSWKYNYYHQVKSDMVCPGRPLCEFASM